MSENPSRQPSDAFAGSQSSPVMDPQTTIVKAALDSDSHSVSKAALSSASRKEPQNGSGTTSPVTDRSGLNLPKVSNNFIASTISSSGKAAATAGVLTQKSLLPPGKSLLGAGSADRQRPDAIGQSLVSSAKGGSMENSGNDIQASGEKGEFLPKNIFVSNGVQRGSYAGVVAPQVLRRPDVSTHKFTALQAQDSGHGFTLTLPSEFCKERFEEFQFSIIGRLLLKKGDKPRSTANLKQELQSLWKLSSTWKLIPMCKGFFILKFQTMEEKNLVKARSLWELSKGSLRIRDWVKGFNPYKEVSSLSQIWVRIYCLPVEFWHPEVITAIGNVIGTSIKIDGASAHADVGHFVKLLVEVDLSLPLQESMHVQGDDTSYHVYFYYEKLPLYCTHCRITGHSVDKCNKVKKQPRDEAEKLESKDATHPGVSVSKKPSWQAKARDNNVVSMDDDANRFRVLEDNEVGEIVVAGPEIDDDFTRGAGDVRHRNSSAPRSVAWSKVTEQAVTKQIAVPVLEKEAVETRNAFQALDLENNAQTVLDMGVDPISGTSFGVHLFGPNLLEKDLVPIQGDKDVIIKDSDLVINEEDSDVEETLEMEAPDGAGLNSPIIDDTVVARERDPTLDKRGGVSHERNKDLSALGPDNIASRISQLEEQASQGMKMLSDKTTKRGRGRPKGTGKGMGREPIQAVPEGSIKGRLRNAGEMGYKPRDFVLDCSNSDSMRAMNNIVHRRWSDEMDDYPDLWDC